MLQKGYIGGGGCVGIHHDWQNIVRIMNTQKATTTSFEIKSGKQIHIRKCSEPIKEVQEIYDALGFKDRPYRRRKYVLPETEKLLL